MREVVCSPYTSTYISARAPRHVCVVSMLCFLHLQISLHILLYLLVNKSLSTVVSAVAFLCAHLRVWAPECVSCSTSVYFERRIFLQEACVPCPHGAGNSATSALAIPAVAAVAKLPVAEAVAMLHSVRSPRLWRLRLQYRYHTHQFCKSKRQGQGQRRQRRLQQRCRLAPSTKQNPPSWHTARRIENSKKGHLQLPAAFLPDRSW